MDPAALSEPTNWYVLLDLLVPFAVVLAGLAWYDQKLRRARHRSAVDQGRARDKGKDGDKGKNGDQGRDGA